MARTRSYSQKKVAKEKKVRFPYETPFSPTSVLLQKVIYWPVYNEWREPIEASQTAISDHPCRFVLVSSSKDKRKKKFFGHRQLPKQYLDKPCNK
jgi:hypothetical protein